MPHSIWFYVFVGVWFLPLALAVVGLLGSIALFFIPGEGIKGLRNPR